MEILADITATHIINASSASINLTEWLFTLKDHEYQACSKAHIACGASVSATGKRMSLNVEQVGDSLLVQHYAEDISERHHCRVVSISDSFTAAGRSTIGVIWEVTVKSITENVCEYSNRVIVHTTEQLLEALASAGIIDVAFIKERMTKNAGDHNKEETPLFATDIERKALAGIWQ